MSVTLPGGLHPFLAAAGWGDSVVEPLAGDASFRRYFRIRSGDRTAMLMDAPMHRQVSMEDKGCSAPSV